MKAALISLGSESSEWTLAGMKKYFTSVEAINIKGIEVHCGSGSLEVLSEGKPISAYDCIYAKGSFRYAQALRSLTHALFKKAYMPIKPATFTLGHDKMLTHLALQLYKIPMPNTYLASSPEAAKKILKRINYPIIIKLPSGTGGKGVMYADAYATASSLLDTLATLRQPFLIQEYIETSGEDVRVIVCGEKVIASMKRKAILGEKRSNIHAGARGENYLIDASTKKICVDAAKSIGAEVCAIDLLESIKGPMVIEINLSPGLQGITEATGVDVADAIAKYLFERASSIKDAGMKKETDEFMEEMNKKKAVGEQQIVTNLDFRGERILLPKLVSDMAKFDEKDEFIITVSAGKLSVEKV